MKHIAQYLPNKFKIENATHIILTNGTDRPRCILIETVKYEKGRNKLVYSNDSIICSRESDDDSDYEFDDVMRIKNPDWQYERLGPDGFLFNNPNFCIRLSHTLPARNYMNLLCPHGDRIKKFVKNMARAEFIKKIFPNSLILNVESEKINERRERDTQIFMLRYYIIVDTTNVERKNNIMFISFRNTKQLYEYYEKKTNRGLWVDNHFTIEMSYPDENDKCKPSKAFFNIQICYSPDKFQWNYESSMYCSLFAP